MRNILAIPFACAFLFAIPDREDEPVEVKERLNIESVVKEIGMDPRRLYVVNAKVTEVDRKSDRKAEHPRYLAEVHRVDGKRPKKTLRFWCDELPSSVKVGEAHDYFAALKVRSGGALEATEYARKFPIPPFEELLMNGPSFALNIRMKFFGRVSSNPFEGGEPPGGEPWLLPDGFFDRKLEQNRSTKTN